MMKKTLFAAVVLFSTTVSTTHSMQQLVRMASGVMGKLKNVRWKSDVGKVENMSKGAVLQGSAIKMGPAGLVSFAIMWGSFCITDALRGFTLTMERVQGDIEKKIRGSKYAQQNLNDLDSTIKTESRLNRELQEELAKSPTKPHSFFNVQKNVGKGDARFYYTEEIDDFFGCEGW